MKQVIRTFRGDLHWLSNFAPFGFRDKNGVGWPTVEHFYQAAKTFDKAMRRKIWAAETPGKAKKLGREVELRSDWNDIRLTVMKIAVRKKFDQNPVLMKRLLNTGFAFLIEGNHWHDNFWGDCECPNCINIPGENHLGIILMELREFYRVRKELA